MSIFEIRYENGASHTIPADSHEEALKIAKVSLRSCLPKDFDPKNIVRVTIVRRTGFCALCGKEFKTKKDRQQVDSSVGNNIFICKEHRLD